MPKTNYECVKTSRQRRKKDILYVMGDSCSICGYNKCSSALELHHLNPEEKDFTISTTLNRAWEVLDNELKKCTLVCSNCHREIHEGLITQELHSTYSAERAEQISERLQDLKTKKIFYCKNCGAVISAHASYCANCSNLQKRKAERPSREELKQLIRNKTFVEIGKMFNVSDNAIRKWCVAEKLPSRKIDINKYTDEDWLEI